MGKSRRFRSGTFVENQRALMAALIVMALLDLVASMIFIKVSSRETARQMQQMTELYTQQVYEECERLSDDMQRLLMENQDLIENICNGTKIEQIAAKGSLLDRMKYSLGNASDYLFFFYFEQQGDMLGQSWLKLEAAKDDGIIPIVLRRIEENGDRSANLFRWENFEYGGQWYILQAYHYNGVWFICYGPAQQLVAGLEQIYGDENNMVFLMDGENRVLYGNEKLEAWDISEEMRLGGTWYRFPLQRIQIVCEESPLLKLSVGVAMKGYGVFSRLVLLQAVVLFMVLLTLAAFLVMTVYTKRRIIAPVQKFVRGLQEYQEGNESRETLTVSDIHELEQINEQFRNFVHQIGALKISIYEEQLERQRLEMDNIKLQLKPHFFLNCLSLVHRLLESGDSANAGRICLATIRYLRYLFGSGMDDVCLSDAIAHVNDYFEIMKLRYPDEVDMDIYVDKDVKNCRIPPMMIQTLVENSMKYGKRSGQKLEISVTVTVEYCDSEKYLCINISDNGNGYPKECLSLWEQDMDLERDNGQHIGIAYVRARLRMDYGARGKVFFYNSPMGGAVTEIYIPMNEADAHEQGGGSKG